MTRMTRRDVLNGLAAATMAAGMPRLASAATAREDTLRYVMGPTWNQVDPGSFGSTRNAMALSVNVYDRLVSFGRKPSQDGAYIFDFDTIVPELAESFTVSEDGLTITFRLKPDARWHDGTAVTAEDVKWSLDRMVSANLMSKAQMATGSITSADQFRVVDARTVTVSLPRPDRLALPNLATYFAPMINARLARSHATDDDPWALDWLKMNAAGGGAYRIEQMRPDGQQVALSRNDDWTGGAAPGFARVIVQTVPDAATRAALMQRGDADLALDIAAVDIPVMEKTPGVKVISTTIPSAFTALVFNTTMAPFDDARVRRAVSMALPYDKIFASAANGRGAPLFGAEWKGGTPASGAFPQAMPVKEDLEAARALLAEAGQAGFETELYYTASIASYADPAAALIQEALGRIGIKVSIRKTPDAQMAEIVTKKSAPLSIETSWALFPSTEYFFRIFLSGESRWNFSGWRNDMVEALLPQARYETDQAKYDDMARQLVAEFAADMPMAMLWQPAQDSVMRDRVGGFTAWYSYKADFRQLQKDAD